MTRRKKAIGFKVHSRPVLQINSVFAHEVSDIASLASFSFGLEEEDRYVMLWKKEFAPTDEELLAYRREEEWDPEKAKQIIKQREEERLQSQYVSPRQKGMVPQSNYRDKYKHLIGDTAAKEAAQSTKTDRSYGFVSSENKRDHRTIEQVLADTKAKKKQKLEHENENQSGHSAINTSVTSYSDIINDTDLNKSDSGSNINVAACNTLNDSSATS